MKAPLTVAVVGLEDGPESCAGPGLLAALGRAGLRRLAVACRAGESGAFRPGIAELFERAGDPLADEPGFVARLAECCARHSVGTALAGTPLVAQVLARHAKTLAKHKLKLLLPASADLERLRERGLTEPCSAAQVAALPSSPVPEPAFAASFLHSRAWPLVLLDEHGARRRALDALEALRLARALRERGARQLRMASPAPRSLFEVCLVLARSGALLGSCAVRVLEDDERLRPWLAVSVEDAELERAALAVATRAGLRGPLTATFSQSERSLALLDLQPCFPVWIEACLREGPNLAALAVSAAVEARTRPAGRVPAGTLFSQTAQDIVIDPRSPAACAVLP